MNNWKASNRRPTISWPQISKVSLFLSEEEQEREGATHIEFREHAMVDFGTQIEL